jgi:mono/diheme cytochrome c family protein
LRKIRGASNFFGNSSESSPKARLLSLAALAAFPLSASADEAAPAKQVETGKMSYMMCAACHGMDGKGVAAGPSLMAPTLVGSKVALGDPAVMVLVILNGIRPRGGCRCLWIRKKR